jgi:hypothetical protein
LSQDGKHVRCRLPKCSGQFHRLREELRQHVTLSHLSRSWLPCPAAGGICANRLIRGGLNYSFHQGCKASNRQPQLVSHFVSQHAGLLGQMAPNDALKMTWWPFMCAPPEPEPLPRSAMRHDILAPPIRMSWKWKRMPPPCTPPPSRSNTNLTTPAPQASPRKKQCGPSGSSVAHFDDEEETTIIAFDDLVPFDAVRVVEVREYMVRRGLPGVDKGISAPRMAMRETEPEDDPKAPGSILFPCWAQRLAEAIEQGIVKDRGRDG